MYIIFIGNKFTTDYYSVMDEWKNFLFTGTYLECYNFLNKGHRKFLLL